MEKHGAFTVAEGNYLYKTDVSLAFGGNKSQKDYILRTSLNKAA